MTQIHSTYANLTYLPFSQLCHVESPASLGHLAVEYRIECIYGIFTMSVGNSIDIYCSAVHFNDLSVDYFSPHNINISATANVTYEFCLIEPRPREQGGGRGCDVVLCDRMRCELSTSLGPKTVKRHIHSLSS